MEDVDFDRALIGSAFAEAARTGWAGLSVASAARAADLPMDRARQRFPTRGSILRRLGQLADRYALAQSAQEGQPRELLFDLLMSRFESLQPYRHGIQALLSALPGDPAAALMLADATRRSMGWMLEAAGIPATGLPGALRTQGVLAVWLYTLRAWQRDESPDLAGTMAALDRALARAEQAARFLPPGRPVGEATGPKPFPEPTIPEPEAPARDPDTPDI
jgi:ubiquinone biosynthesis protein COQ9